MNSNIMRRYEKEVKLNVNHTETIAAMTVSFILPN